MPAPPAQTPATGPRPRRAFLNPVTARRLRRFRGMRRAWFSFRALAALYGLSLFSELIANDRPLLVRFEGRWLAPVLRYYPEDRFLRNGRQTRPDYKALARSALFAGQPANRMLWPPVASGPLEILRPEDLAVRDETQLRFEPEPRVASVNVDRAGRVARALGGEPFLGVADAAAEGVALAERWPLPAEARAALGARFENRPQPAWEGVVRGPGGAEAVLSLAPFAGRPAPPETVRLTLREARAPGRAESVALDARGRPAGRGGAAFWAALPPDRRAALAAQAARSRGGAVPDAEVEHGGVRYRVRFLREAVRFPFRPHAGHPLGIDSAGRDLFARLLYGLRIAMTFGLLLVAGAMGLGTLVGAVQGYYGGWVDLAGQRLTEIWESLPFLYILILLGSVYGPSFGLLLVTYGVFNWIGISYYMRAEFLRLRRHAFVEAARCLGVPSRRIMFRHILPNALVPLITFFPFSLIGAIGVLAALDYLGFGLPPPTPSWGELLAQAQEYSRAWWLVLYPSLALFVVMLLGVFVGEGVRSAFDPRRFSRME